MSRPEPTHLTITTPDGELPAWLWRPATGTGPGVVLFQEIFGVGSYIQDRAADLAELGYVVLAPEFYWRLGLAATQERGPEALREAMAVVGRLDWDAAVADGLAAVEHLKGRIEVTGTVGLLGFCLGGGLAFAVAVQDDPDALVSYYGSALPDLHHLADRVVAPSLHHFGLADTFIPEPTVRQIERSVTAQPGGVFETYAGAGHAFDNPAPEFHHAEASAAAWVSTVRFLAEHLGQTGAAVRE